MKKALNKTNNKILITPILTILFLLIIYFIKGIYPFGLGTIIDGDLYQGGVPSFYYLWDLFHGGNLLYDFSTACGFDRLSIISILNPANWFLLLIPRSAIVNSISILLIFKFAIIALTSSYAFSKLIKNISTPWLVLSSLMYTFCGYNMQYFTNLDWLDAVALYPLIMLFAYNMIKGKSKVPYVIALSYILIFNTYMAFFIVVSLIVFGGLYIFIIEEKDTKLKATFSLGVGTIISLIASAYSVYSFITGVLGGARFNMSVGDEAETTSEESLSIIDKIAHILINNNLPDLFSLLMFLGTEIAIACIAILTIKSIKRKNFRKYAIFFALVISALFIQRFCLATDLFWHMGSHVMFPYRNGYMVGFFSAIVVAFCFSSNEFKEGFNFKKDIINLIIPLFAVFSIIFFIPYLTQFYSNFVEYDVLSYSLLQATLAYPYAMFSLFLIIPLFILLMFKYKNLKNCLVFIIVLGFIGVNSYILIGHSGDFKRVVNYRSYYSNIDIVAQNINSNDYLERVNNPDLSLITNYPYMSSVSSNSNWTHSLSDHQMEAFENLGFSTVYTRTLDSGGTAFSKALLHITDSVSKCELDSNYYTNVKTAESFNFYSNNFILPVGIVANNSILDISYGKNDNVFTYQNKIYHSLCSDNNDLFNALQLNNSSKEIIKSADYLSAEKTFFSKDEVIKHSSTIRIDGKQAIYISSYNKECDIYQIRVNDEKINIYQNAEKNSTEVNYKYPTEFNNNVIYLGTFDSCEVEFTYFTDLDQEASFDIYAMDYEKLYALCKSYNNGKNYTITKNGVDLKFTSEDDGIAFVPLSYSDYWNVTVNGEKVQPVCLVGNFLGIRVRSGESNISIRYSYLPALKLIIFSLLGIALAGALLLIDKKIKEIPKPLEELAFVAFTVLCTGVYLIFYIIPVAFEIFT